MIVSSYPSIIVSADPSMIVSSYPSIIVSADPSMIVSSYLSLMVSADPCLIVSVDPCLIVCADPPLIVSTDPSLNVSADPSLGYTLHVAETLTNPENPTVSANTVRPNYTANVAGTADFTARDSGQPAPDHCTEFAGLVA